MFQTGCFKTIASD